MESRRLLSNYYVAPRGNDSNPGTLVQPFATIRHALAAADQPGDHVVVRKGTYREHLVLPHGGSAEAGPFVLENYPGERPTLSGAGLKGGNMILIEDLSYVVIRGFDIRNNTRVSDGSGIRIVGSGSNIELRDNKIHHMLGHSAMGITVYGTSEIPISNLIVDRNEIYNIQAAPSEALTLNGNVTGFQITNNRVHDVNNIGIDMIGGEADIHPTQVARNGLVKGNVVYRARSNYGGGFAAGIYVDGGRDIVIDGNVVYQNNVGIEVGAENLGIVASGIVVQSNLVYWNDKAGLGFGGYDKDRTGRVQGCTFVNNTVYKNDTHKTAFGQLWIQYASQNTVANNIFWASANNVLVDSWDGNVDNALDNNLWYTESPSRKAVFTWNGQPYTSFASYQAATQQDAHSLFADPKFVKRIAADFHLSAVSAAINAGSATPGQFAPTDFDGRTRPQGTQPCIGAYEYVPESTSGSVAEQWEIASAPSLTGIETVPLSYTENDPATPITATITVSDEAKPNLVRAVVEITGNYQRGLDVLSFRNTPKIKGTWDAKTGRLTLAGRDTVANYQAALRAVKYRNTSAIPSPAPRVVALQVFDGAAASNKVTRTIAVTPVDDPPVLTKIELKPLVYLERQPATPITASIMVGDADDVNLARATVQITNNYQAGQDILSFVNTTRIRGTWNAATGMLTLAGVDTLARYQTALRSVKYRNTSSNPGAAARTVSFVASDGLKSSFAATRTIAVKGVNNAPVLAGIETTALRYAKNQAPTPVSATITASDIDNSNLAGATVRITGGYQKGQDVLALAGTTTIRTIWDTETGTLTLRGNDTVAAYQAALREVTYQNTGVTPNMARRTVTFRVLDGVASSKPVSRTIQWATGAAAALEAREPAANDAAIVALSWPIPNVGGGLANHPSRISRFSAS